jgi:Mlc titration factor MtfA (ptsG expression regulator)
VARGFGTLLTVAAGLAGAELGGAVGALGGIALGGAAALAAGYGLQRKRRRRRAILAAPFPAAWRRVLERRSAHYRRLAPDWRGRFEADVRLFVAEKRITGVETAVTDELRVLVAASAVTLSIGWPTFEWDRLTEVLLYPEAFDHDYHFDRRTYAGMAHPSGEVILSIPALRRSFADPDDGYHAGYHEFAHLLDLEVSPTGMHFDGLPVGVVGAAAEWWTTLARREIERVRRGDSLLDGYAATNAVEFFAVAVEAFFERPVALRAHHAALYGALAAYFRQDPAAWETGVPTVRPRLRRRARPAVQWTDLRGRFAGALLMLAIGVAGVVWTRALALAFWSWLLVLVGLGAIIALAVIIRRDLA